ncbi:hypothetical protein V8E51_010980 [Hyaloscypha variabilis]
MDVVGSITTVITLAQVVVEGIKIAKTLYQAPEELAALQQTTLSRVQLTIEELHQLIQKKILKNVNGTLRARRRAWARNKSTIYRLRDTLKESRENLLAALTANSSSVSGRTEASLTLIRREICSSHETTLSLNRQLFDIQKSLSTTHDAILSQSQTVSTILDSVSGNTTYQLNSNNHQPLLTWHASGAFLEPTMRNLSGEHGTSLHSDDNQQDYTASYLRIQDFHCSPRASRNPRRALGSANPASPFELSQNFFPELYTSEGHLSNFRLAMCSAYEESCSAYFRTNFYQFFFSKTPRQHYRVSLSITVSRSSGYWDLIKISPAPHQGRVWVPNNCLLPHSLSTRAENFISEIENLQDDTHLTLSLTERCRSPSKDLEEEFQILPRRVMTPVSSQEILALLEDLGCPRYFEHELIQIAMIRTQNQFATCAKGKLFYETKFTTSSPTSSSLYQIQLLHCMKGASGIPKFAGIVVDSTGMRLKGYLTEVLPQGWPFDLIYEEATAGRKLPWTRRERWARQIVEAVSQVHSKGFVIGTSGFRVLSIVIDNSDRVLLWVFDNKIGNGHISAGYMPPEYRYFQKASTPRPDIFNATTKSDIFQLGIVLWLLAENQRGVSGAQLCHRVGCQRQPGAPCYDQHSNPIALPPMANDVPEYYKAIVAACRLEQPNSRPSAWRLLEMFPPNNASEYSQIETSTMEAFGIGLLRNRFAGWIFCDVCRKRTETHFFHCNTCHTGDYDICSDCFCKGIHCEDEHHFLVEIKSEQQFLAITKNYYSSRGVSGNRDVIKF